MTKKPKFVDSFWDSDIASTRGSDVIVRRMKEGKKVCKELVEYLSERSKAEATFAKALKNAARKLDSNMEIGELGLSISTLKSETEHISAAHEAAGNDMSALSIELSNFNKEQEAIKSQRAEHLQKSTSNKLTSNSKANTLKEKYVQRCRERDTADDAYKAARNSVATQTKDLQKAEKNKEKCYDNMQNADTAYKSSLETLEAARKAWESTMVETCEAFQQIEDDRIYLTRNILWKITNVDSQACVIQDNCAEKIRQALEKCDIETDLQTFIDNYGVGRVRPERVPYVNYYERRGSQSSPSTVTGTGTRPRQPLPPAGHTMSGGGAPRSQPGRPTGPPRGPPPKQPPLISLSGDDDGAYASISTTTNNKRMANVVHAHEAKIIVEASERL
ncbi:proline-serine-threonine phosphatase-interacting protein 1-like isoform X2 [Pecten maximus]|uniref:proline-serine-threonine phosphatase-interacting protein 1-like isoform X2 n=1 Tax=Pecten maximus TaxID=6579 RepID=UPI001458E804|nr:proline-serine-threonine phosphatase-interacting protein 1-like isoform X2 [Pecten maximus]